MITTRKFLRFATLVTAGTLLACVDTTAPIAPAPTAPAPIGPGHVFTSLEIQSPTSSMVPVAPLNTGRLEVRAKDQRGRPMIVETASFSISSSNPGVAAVRDAKFWTSSSNGIPDDSWISAEITAISEGEAVISILWTIGGVTKTATSRITVESLEGWSLKVTPTALTVELGASELIQAWIVDSNGKERIPYPVFTFDRDGVVGLFEAEWCFYWPCDGINVRGLAVGEVTLTTRFQSLSAKLIVTVVPST